MIQTILSIISLVAAFVVLACAVVALICAVDVRRIEKAVKGRVERNERRKKL